MPSFTVSTKASRLAWRILISNVTSQCRCVHVAWRSLSNYDARYEESVVLLLFRSESRSLHTCICMYRGTVCCYVFLIFSVWRQYRIKSPKVRKFWYVLRRIVCIVLPKADPDLVGGTKLKLPSFNGGFRELSFYCCRIARGLVFQSFFLLSIGVRLLASNRLIVTDH